MQYLGGKYGSLTLVIQALALYTSLYIYLINPKSLLYLYLNVNMPVLLTVDVPVYKLLDDWPTINLNQMLHSVAYDLVLHHLFKPGCLKTWGKYAIFFSVTARN